MKKIHLTFFTSLLFYSLNAQHPTATRDYIGNHIFWMNTQLHGKIAGKFNYSLDIEYRRQADPKNGYEKTDVVGNSNFNIIKNPYQNALRPWIHYKLSDNLRFSWSPVTWFSSWSFPANGKTTYQPEFRTSPQITFFQNQGRIKFMHRYRYEFRFFGLKMIDENTSDPTGPNDSYDFPKSNRQGRFRYLIRAALPLNSLKIETGTYYITAADEIFINTGKNIPSNKLFDQNRFYMQLGYKFSHDIKLEVGYLNQLVFRMNNAAKNNVDFNNNLVISLVFENFNGLFKKKAKE